MSELSDEFRVRVRVNLISGITPPCDNAKWLCAKGVILLAYGERSDGKPEPVGFLLAQGESEARRWGLLGDVKSRGLVDPSLIMTDTGGGGLKALAMVRPRAGGSGARAVGSDALAQRCQSAERIIYGLIAYVLNQSSMEIPGYELTEDA